MEPPVRADQVADHAALVQRVRVDLRRQPELAERLANDWLDARRDDWVGAILSAELGSHQPHFEAYRLLTDARRAALVGAVADVCLEDGRRGLDAGAFMIGRFVSVAHPVAFWNALSDRQVALVLDEWTRYAQYLALLDEVGARRLRQARRRIEEGGLPPLSPRRSELLVFVPLKLSERSLERVADALGDGAEGATREALAVLREPYGALFDYARPWSLARLEEMCREAGLPVPSADAC